MRPLLLLATALSVTAAAQDVDPESFFPYSPGNVWEYEVTSWGTGHFASDSATTYTTLTIVRDTVIEGQNGSVYVVARLDSLRNPVSESVCHGYLEEREYGYRWTTPLSACLVAPTQYSGNHIGYVSAGGNVDIGGMTYPVPSFANGGTGFGCGSGGTECRYEWARASQIGLTSWRSEQTRTLSPWYSLISTALLVRARVGEQTYGASTVPNEAGPEISGEALSMTAFPNPTQRATKVTVGGAAAGPLALALHDALGRRIWSQEGGRETTLDLSDLPVGVYLLRAVDGNGATATLRVTRSR